MTDSSGQAPAGWYADTNQPGTERWWDGQAWTEHTRPSVAAPPPPPPTSPFQPQSAAGYPGAVGYAGDPALGQAEPQQPQQPQPKQNSGCFGIATGVMIGIIAAIVILVGGCVAVVAGGLNAANDDLANLVSTIEAGEMDALADEGEPGGSSSEPLFGSSDGLDDVVSCERTDPQTIVLEVVNSSSDTSSYVITVGFFDDAGNRLADEPMFLNHLRPGERAIEKQFTFDEQGTVCEVIDVDRFASESTSDDLAQASECEIGADPDALGSIEASLSVTNDSPETSDFAVDVVFIDSDGVRRGSGATYIQAVRSGEIAPGDVFTVLDHDEGYSCEVVAVTRLAS